MENPPLISVILPVYNGEKYIKRAINSILDQTFNNLELIIINDGSTDRTQEIILESAKENNKIIILVNGKNLGLVESLNKGVELARGKYIARLDDDDFWTDSKKLEKQVDFLEKNRDYGLVGGGMIKIDEQRKEVSRYLFPEKDEDIRKAILLFNPFVHTSVVFRKDIFQKSGGYDNHFLFFEDWDLWMKIGKISKFYNFKDYFVCYLDHECTNSFGYRNYGIRRNIKLNLELRKKYKESYPGFNIAALLCIASYLYSFIPFKQKLQPFILKIKKIFTRWIK